jgi:hypothetical protein
MPSYGAPAIDSSLSSQRSAETTAPALIPQTDVTLHILDQQGVLFDAARQCAYAINATGTFIWCCLERGMAPQEIVEQLGHTFGISAGSAEDYLGTALRHWRELNLLSLKPPPNTTAVPPRGSCLAEEAGRVGRAGAPTHRRQREGARPYALLDVTFDIRVSAPTLRKEIDLVLSPLSVAAAVSRAMIRLELLECAGGFSIRREGRPFAACERLDQAVPLVKSCLIELAFGRSGDFGAVHAAALHRNGRCILLAGASGAGKSTLTAALVAAGFELMADDTTVLARDTLEARAVPFAICLKEGAWELLRTRFPDLDGRPIHDRLDGKKVRYLLPAADHVWAKPAMRSRVDSLVFLNRVPEPKSSLRPIDRVDALSRLAREFCPLGDGLTAEKMEQLVAWIGAVDCLELRYSPLDDGVEQLAKHCA